MNLADLGNNRCKMLCLEAPIMNIHITPNAAR